VRAIDDADRAALVDPDGYAVQVQATPPGIAFFGVEQASPIARDHDLPTDVRGTHREVLARSSDVVFVRRGARIVLVGEDGRRSEFTLNQDPIDREDGFSRLVLHG